jgi:hypothetical protein
LHFLVYILFKSPFLFYEQPMGSAYGVAYHKMNVNEKGFFTAGSLAGIELSSGGEGDELLCRYGEP